MPALKTAVPKSGDDTCPQCWTLNVETHKCRATGEYYCEMWECMKKAGVPSVVNPPKRPKKEPGAGELNVASVGGRIGASQHWREPICTPHVKIDSKHIAREFLDAGNGYEGDTARGK